MANKVKKIYVYVDETGQDSGSNFFVVVSIISEDEQQAVRNKLVDLERKTKVGSKKWKKSRSPENEEYLQQTMHQDIAAGDIYYGKYAKPLPFFLPMLEVVEKAIKDKMGKQAYQAIIYVDGIDKKKALELTNALRLKDISLRYVRTSRDESEPFIRLADRWAGCIRASLQNNKIDKELLEKAEKNKYLKHI